MLDKNVKQEKKNFISENVKKKVIRDQSKKKKLKIKHSRWEIKAQKTVTSINLFAQEHKKLSNIQIQTS
jgi:hypothetical protein